MKNTKCLFAVNGKVCTHKKVYDKESCSTDTLIKGYTDCVYLYTEEKAKEYFKESK